MDMCEVARRRPAWHQEVANLTRVRIPKRLHQGPAKKRLHPPPRATGSATVGKRPTRMRWGRHNHAGHRVTPGPPGWSAQRSRRRRKSKTPVKDSEGLPARLQRRAFLPPSLRMERWGTSKQDGDLPRKALE